MRKEYAAYLTYGAHIKRGMDRYFITGSYDEGSGKIPCVNIKYQRIWTSLHTYSGNKRTEESQVKVGDLVEYLTVEEVEPLGQVRFIDCHYQDKFLVPAFGRVRINEEVRVAVPIDDYHLFLIKEDQPSSARSYHICQFAELCERYHIKVEPIDVLPDDKKYQKYGWAK